MSGRYLILFGAVMLVALLSGCAAPAQDDRTEKPNIVFIVADDMRADDFEHMPQTRRLLAEEGLTFEKAFVTNPLCCPSRASILRGQYTHNHQILINDSPEGGFEKFRSMGHEDSTVATWLKDGGYQTVLIGKYLNGYATGQDTKHVPPGWDEWYGSLGVRKSYYDYRLNENSTVVSYGSEEQDYHTDVLADKAKDYVRRAATSGSSPFFMYLAPAAPHSPFMPAPRHEDAYVNTEMPRPPSFDEPDTGDKPAWVHGLSRLGPAEEIDDAYRNRLRMLLSLDEMVAGLVEELRAAGELDDTYVFFTSDNGYHLGEHRLGPGKRTVYEEAVRVPLAVRGPGVLAGQAVEQMALNIDLAPTIAELAGVSAPAFVDGRSLVPLLSGTPPATWRSASLLEHWSGGRAHHRPAPTYAAIRTETYKYVEHAPGDEELYDLSSDPHELESLHANADPALVESLKSHLEALKACAGQPCREAEDAP